MLLQLLPALRDAERLLAGESDRATLPDSQPDPSLAGAARRLAPYADPAGAGGAPARESAVHVRAPVMLWGSTDGMSQSSPGHPSVLRSVELVEHKSLASPGDQNGLSDSRTFSAEGAFARGVNEGSADEEDSEELWRNEEGCADSSYGSGDHSGGLVPRPRWERDSGGGDSSSGGLRSAPLVVRRWPASAGDSTDG
jgi:hypothetical protein